MYRITRDNIVYSIDKRHPPVLEIDLGEIVVLETCDARTLWAPTLLQDPST